MLCVVVQLHQQIANVGDTNVRKKAALGDHMDGHHEGPEQWKQMMARKNYQLWNHPKELR